MHSCFILWSLWSISQFNAKLLWYVVLGKEAHASLEVSSYMLNPWPEAFNQENFPIFQTYLERNLWLMYDLTKKLTLKVFINYWSLIINLRQYDSVTVSVEWLVWLFDIVLDLKKMFLWLSLDFHIWGLNTSKALSNISFLNLPTSITVQK